MRYILGTSLCQLFTDVTIVARPNARGRTVRLLAGRADAGSMPNIRVAVRVRPMNKRERARSSSPCIVVQDGTQARRGASRP